MTLDDMVRGLDVALDPEQGLSPDELDALSEVILLDKNGGMLRIKKADSKSRHSGRRLSA